MKKTVRITAIVASILITLIVAPVIVIPLIIDPNDYKEDIAGYVREKTGRELVFEGDIDLFFVPWLGLELGHVKLGNAPGFGKEVFARVESAKVKIKILPFLMNQLEVETFSLQGLEINLKRDKSGRTNWEDLLNTGAAEKKEGEKEVGWLKRISLIPSASLRGVQINDARIVWDDRQKGNYAVITGLDLYTDRVALNEPFYLNLAFSLKNRRPHIKGHVDLFVKMTLDPEAQIVHLEKTTVALQLTGKSVPSGKAKASLMADVSLELAKNVLKMRNLNFDALGMSVKGYLSVSRLFDKPAFKGKLKVSRFNPRKFMSAMGKTPPKTADPKALSKASVDLVFDASTRVLNMKKVVLKVDDATIKGHASIKDFAKREVSFDLVADRIDVDRYLPPKPKGKKRKVAHRGKGTLPLGPLDALELDGKLRIGRLKVHNLRMQDVHMAVNGHRGTIRLHPFKATLYPGKHRKDKIASSFKMIVQGDLRVRDLLNKAAISGKLRVSRFSPRKLIRAMGKTPPKTADPKALSKASADLELDASARALNVKELVLKLDHATIKGHVSIKNFDKPEISFDLMADRFDVDRYLPPRRKRKRKPKIKALSKRKAAQKSREELLFEPLRGLELSGKLRIGKTRVYNLRMKDVSMTVTARKGVIRLHPLKASLYQGKYSGDMTFNLQGRIPKITTMEELKKIQVGQLLKDLIGERKISGTANVSVRLTTRGRTDWALRRALNGNVSFSVTDGRLRGLTIPVVKVDNRSIHEEAASKTVKKTNWTDFSVARGTVWIKKGVARNNDFDFISTTVKANGKGHADLIAEQLDYLLYVQIPSLATFPIRIHGPFSKPETKLQVGEMIKVNLIGMGKDLKETFKKSRESIEDIGEGVRDMFIGIFH